MPARSTLIADPQAGPRSEDTAAHAAEHAATRSAADTSTPGEVLDRGMPRLPPGSSIDRYVILEQIGEGGMSVVYAATDPRLARTVAIKVMRDVSSSGRSAERLVRETHALARVIHPNVVPVYDAGTVRGQAYLVEEYVDGGTLTQWLARERRAWRDILDRFLLAGRGLQAAHEAGLVHRDFKPDNVLLGRDGRVRVVDFGLSSRAIEPAGPTPEPGAEPVLDRRLTRVGAVMGTPAYMAPEQYAAQTTDARTDLFGFCVALWEALYHEHPFGGRTIAERAEAVMRGALRPVPPSPVPRRILRALQRGLRVAPDERPASMAALLAALSPGRHASRTGPPSPARRRGDRVRDARCRASRRRAHRAAGLPGHA